MTAAKRVLVITGAASGLGRAIATQASGEGWAVALLDRDEAAVKALASELGGLAVAADVSDRSQLHEAFATVAGELGEVHGLVNSAGLTRPGKSESLAEEDWKLVIDVDLSGTFYACQAVHSHLAAGGSIVNIASIGSARGLPQRAAYSAAKAGVVGLTKALATEWAAQQIRVNAVGPAWVDTPLVRGMIEAGTIVEQELIDKIPLGRFCAESDVASAVLFLLSNDKSAFITGQTLYVDGGYVWAG